MASKCTFAGSLLAENCHENLVALNDGEIRSLEQIRAYLVKQIHITEQFVQAMTKLNSSNIISKVDLDEHSPFVQIWKVFSSENTNRVAVLNQFTSMFATSIMPRFDKLLTCCKELQKQYKLNRFRIDSELKAVCEEENRLKTTYRHHANDAESARTRLESSKSSTKGADKGKEEKFLKASLKLYQNHNDYVLALTAATIHQRHYQDGIIPNMMNSLQTVKQDLVMEWKNIFHDFIGFMKTYGEQNIKFSEAIETSMNSINDDNPYEKFLIDKGRQTPPLLDYIFDGTLLEITETDLEANEIGLNDLSYEQLKTKNTLLEQSVDETKGDLSKKSSGYQIAKQMLVELRDSANSCQNIFLKQMAVADLSRDLKEVNCTYEKAVAQHGAISTALETLNGGPPPSFSNSLLSRSTETFGSSETRNSGRTLQRIKEQFAKKAPPIPKKKNNNGDLDHSSTSKYSRDPTSPAAGGASDRPLPEAPGQSDGSDEIDYDEPVETPLQEELWYHGTVSRVDAESMVTEDGDYMVRESSRKAGQFVLTSKWSTFRHFIIQQDETGKFKLEGESFPTVTHLIDYHKKHQCPVTKKSHAMLKNPILRAKTNGKSLSHDNIVVTTKLGRGHFGDVMKGLLKDTNEEVAIKTCRDNVLPEMREKFMQEAEILGQYDHPNIVRLIGVAIDKEPVYIVMELMEGGDFLNHLRKHGSETLPGELIQFAIDAASGMTYLEDKGCIHRDLAARNCLLDKVKILKISDFGMSRETDFYECSNMREIPVKWTAPEALNYSRYTSQSDVWSFGVLLWETYSLGNTPYPGMNNKDTREQVDRGFIMPCPLGTPAKVYNLMKDCWNTQPGDRPRFGEILRRLTQLKGFT